MSPSPSESSLPLLIVCLCAQWCGTCRDYQHTFDRLAMQFEAHRFVWVDVEDQAELVDPIDVVDFPTLLMVRAGKPAFFGPLPPQAETLARLVQVHSESGPEIAEPRLHALADRMTVAFG